MATVGDVGTVRLGRQRSPETESGRFPTPYLRAANVTSAGVDTSDVLHMDFTPAEREVFGLRNGDVLLAEASGSADQVGRSAIWKEELPLCCYQNTLVRFRPHAAVAEYAQLVFQHHAATGAFVRLSRGVGIQHIGAKRLTSMPFPLPPLAEQRRIAEEAGRRMAKLHDAESSLRAALQGVREQVKEILSAAVEGSLVPRQSELAKPTREASMPVANNASASGTEQVPLFGWSSQNPSRDAVDRSLPAGWRWVRVAEAGELRVGRQLSPDAGSGQIFKPYLRVANVFEDRIDIADVKEMAFSPEEFETYRVHKADILLNEGQSPDLVGRPAIFRGELSDVAFQNSLIRFRASPLVDSEFALLVFRRYLHAGTFRDIARWSTNIAHLGLGRLAELPFPLPPLAEQQRIVSDATQRLESSGQQETAILSALSRMPEMRREILATAVAGGLVPQDPSDETAAELLIRLGPPQVDAAPPDRKAESKERTMNRKHRTSGQSGFAPLLDVVKEAGRPLPVAELFKRAGYDRDSTCDIENFYLSLRASLSAGLRTVGEGEAAQVEISDAP